MLNQLIGLLFQVIDFHYQTSIKLKLQTHGSDFILLYVLATFFFAFANDVYPSRSTYCCSALDCFFRSSIQLNEIDDLLSKLIQCNYNI
jgi:hypothetical protein